MEGFILILFIIVILALNVTTILLFKKWKPSLIIAGVVMIILAPILGFSSGALFLHFYDWDSGGTGEGAGYGGAFLGLLTLINGILILFIGIVTLLIRFITKRR